jgi:thioredoxin reductase
MPVRDLIIVGGGPSGLSAAIAAKTRGLDYHVIEQGALVNSIYHFPPQMVFFTTPIPRVRCLPSRRGRATASNASASDAM